MKFIHCNWLLKICCGWAAFCYYAHPANASENDAVCVRVHIQIDQALTLERQGFQASMSLNNGGVADLKNVSVTVNFADQSNLPVVATSDPNNTTAKFFIKLTSSDTLPDTVAAGTVGKFTWLIVPALSAGGADPAGQLYYVGAKLSYTLNGVATNIDVSPDSIRVLPMPQLSLDYFLPYDVYGDDPTTPQIEAPIPFSLGVRVKNTGYGNAEQLKIESSQPKIIDNQQGLAVAFQIIGSEVNGNAVTPSLLVNFGTVAPSRSGTARWVMTSSLYGRFTDFSAAFTHSNDLGGTVTSLITGVATHRLIHDVLVDLPGRDNIRDFLALDTDATRVYESENNDAKVADLSTNATITGSTPAYTVSAPGAIGFSYIKLTDPLGGKKVVASVKRSDGKPINVNNAWLSSTYVANLKQWNYFLNIFDTNNTAGLPYSVVFGDPVSGNHAPVLQVLADRVVHPGSPVGYAVQATDPDNDPITLTASALPVGATFKDNGNGRGTFTWTPASNQTGNYPIQFTASDGKLADHKTPVITVTAGSLLNDWKNRYFPGITDPNIIGDNADPDGDGLTNLVEYALGLDPTNPNSDGSPDIITVDVGGQTYLALSYVGRTDDANLQFSVVAANSTTTPDADWQALTDDYPADQSGVPSGFKKVIIRDNVPIDGTKPKRFLRLGVTEVTPPAQSAMPRSGKKYEP